MHGAALLIGNAAYDPLQPLRTPVSDVRNLANVLRGHGFATAPNSRAIRWFFIWHLLWWLALSDNPASVVP